MINLNGLIVSCQAVEGEPLYGYHMMGVLAKAAVEGGAVAIRTSSVEDIAEVKKAVSVPIIGLIKRNYSDSNIYITPTLFEVGELISTGCEVIAMDATDRRRPHGERLQDLVSFARTNAPGTLLMADIATLEEAVSAEKMGFDMISTTLRSYTESTRGVAIPDYDMIKRTVEAIRKPVIAEGGIWEAEQLERVVALGVHGVVIGTAITRPKEITQRFSRVFQKCV